MPTLLDGDPDQKSQTDRDYDGLFQGMADNYGNETDHPLGDEETKRQNPLASKKKKESRLRKSQIEDGETSDDSFVGDEAADTEREALQRHTDNTSTDKTDFYRPSKKSSNKGLSTMSTGKKLLSIMGGGGILMSLVVGMFMFLTIYRSEHLRNLLWDYRFARIHRQIAKRAEKNLELQKSGALEDASVKELKITKSLSETTPEITARAEAKLAGGEQTEFMQTESRGLLRKLKIDFGERFKSYMEKRSSKYGSRETTEAEDYVAEKEVDVERATRSVTAEPEGALKDAAKEAKNDVIQDNPEPRINDVGAEPKSGVAKETAGSVNGAITKISKGVFFITTACLIRDLSGSLDDALRTRIESPMRLAANLFGTAEQSKAGTNVDTKTLTIQDTQLSQAEKGAGIRLASNPNEKIEDIPKEDQIEVGDLPFTFFGVPLSGIADANGVIDSVLNNKVTKPFFDPLCHAILDPRVQGVVLVAEVISMFVGIGEAAETSGQVLMESFQAFAEVGGKYAVTRIMFEYMIPKLLFSLAGSNGVLSANDPQAGNKLDMGAALLSSQYTRMSGGSAITLAQAEKDQAEALAYEKKIRFKNEGLYAYINPKSPYSILGQISLKLPGNPMEVPAAFLKLSMRSAASALSLKHMPFIGAQQAQAVSVDLYTYGIPQYGIPDSLIDVDPLENAKIVEGASGGLDGQIQKYQDCFTRSLADDIVSSGGFDRASGNCDDEAAQRLGLYIIDNCTSGILSSNEGKGCNFLPGAGDVNEVSSTTSSPSGSIANDLVAGDTSKMTCEAGSDAGVGDGYKDGVLTKIHLCRIEGGIIVNSQISKRVKDMLDSAKSADLDVITGSGAFRTYTDQVAARKRNCPAGVDIYNAPAKSCSPQTSRPGFSNHQMGLAIDFDCSGAQVSSSDKCFEWFTANANQYHMYNLASEPWHWSYDGN